MNEQLLKTPGTDVLSSRKKLEKTLEGGTPPPPLYVLGLISINLFYYSFNVWYCLVQKQNTVISQLFLASRKGSNFQEVNKSRVEI